MNELLKHIKDHWVSTILLVASAVLYITGDADSAGSVFFTGIMLYIFIEPCTK